MVPCGTEKWVLKQVQDDEEAGRGDRIRTKSRRPPMTPEGVTIRHPDKLFIGGEWVARTSGRQLAIVNPNSEEVVARVAEAGPDDMDRAVAAARAAFDHGPWPSTPPAERAARLMAMIDHLEARV